MSSPDPVVAPRGPSRTRLAILALAAIGVSIWHVRLLQFFCDDAYISFRYARNFADGLGLVYNVGERVEGYSNFLWVMIVALGLELGVGAEAWSLGVGLALLGGTFVLAGVWARELFPHAPTMWGVPALLLAALGPTVLWAISGLETIAFTACALAAMLVQVRAGAAERAARALFASGLLYALATLLRPDGVVFGAVAGAHWIVVGAATPHPIHTVRARGARVLRGAVALAGGFFVLFAPFLLWRFAYYGDWLPNTYYVKSGGPTELAQGVRYLGEFAVSYPALTLLFVAGGILAVFSPRYRALRPAFGLLLSSALGFGAYILWVGGDYMALFRFVAPLTPALVLVVCVALDAGQHALVERTGIRPAWRAPLGGVALAGLCLWLVQPSRASCEPDAPTDVTNSVANMRRNSGRWALAGETLRRQLWSDAVVATTAAGALPYHSEHVTIDQSGLCDRHIARVESRAWVEDRPGHTRRASTRYLAERRPDVIVGHPILLPRGVRSFGAPPVEGYVPRALPIEGLEEEGRPLLLYLWLRGDRAGLGERAGMRVPGAAGG